VVGNLASINRRLTEFNGTNEKKFFLPSFLHLLLWFSRESDGSEEANLVPLPPNYVL
jgi:hypothetical protein